MKLQDRNAFGFGRAGWTRLVSALAVLTLAVVLLAAPRVVQAAGYDVPWEWVPLRWDSTAAGVETIQIGDEADTVRTKRFDTKDVDWSAFDPSTSPSGIPIVFVANYSNDIADTVYFRTELCWDGVCTRATRFEAPSVWNSATHTSGGVALAASATKVFWGFLYVERDARNLDNVYAAREFRLLVYGDQAGTAPSLGGVRCWIRIPKRRS